MPGKRSDEVIERMQAALAAFEEAQTAREIAVADALKEGWSVREVQTVSGLSPTTVQKWGHKHGWPTAAQRKSWKTETLEELLARFGDQRQ